MCVTLFNICLSIIDLTLVWISRPTSLITSKQTLTELIGCNIAEEYFINEKNFLAQVLEPTLLFAKVERLSMHGANFQQEKFDVCCTQKRLFCNMPFKGRVS
jgi:hypothetical protein